MKKNDKLNGILLVNKPTGMTSFDVCEKIKRRFNFQKVGHSGTLDPSAKGLLVLGINKGTKILRFLSKEKKEYILTIKWGIKTKSWDLEGDIIERKDCHPLKNNIQSAFSNFIGEKELPIPFFSAKKINGKKMYEMARKDEMVDIKKNMCFHSIEFIDDEKISVVCSEGTYIRSLVYVLGEQLSCPATLSSLIRVKNNNYSLKNAAALNEILNKIELNDIIINYNDALLHLQPLYIDKVTFEDVMFGNYNNLHFAKSGVYRLLYKGDIVAVYDVNENGFKIIKVT